MAAVIHRLHAMFHPGEYHGWGRKRRYFEGWYYKVINRQEDRAYAFIPGIAMNETGEQHAFVQVLDGKKKLAEYHTFPPEAFRPCSGRMDILIGGNRFTPDLLELDLPDIRGKLEFSGMVPWPVRWYSPGIMGPYAFVPFMECYHGILSMDHAISGELFMSGKKIDFTGGRGYLEKDWGHSFPSAYIWMQTNHFTRTGISFKASVAKIPWMGSSFTGFIAGFWDGARLFPFTTYNGTKMEKCFADQDSAELVLQNNHFHLEVLVRRDHATSLASPIGGMMDGRISESMTSDLELRLTDLKKNQIIFRDKARNVALELAGKIEEILT
jgi:hypothetical protein